MKNIKLISITSCISIFLLTIALLTINRTFSLNSNEKKWDIHFESNSSDVLINESRVDYTASVEYGSTYSLVLDIVNNGDYNAEIYKVIKTKLSDMKIPNSNYSYDDFFSYSITYENDNTTNGIKKLDRVSTLDLLNAKTTNKIRVDIRYDNEKIDEKKKDFLKQNNNTIKLNLFLQLSYEQI